jgi:hypothetical protein
MTTKRGSRQSVFTKDDFFSIRADPEAPQISDDEWESCPSGKPFRNLWVTIMRTAPKSSEHSGSRIDSETPSFKDIDLVFTSWQGATPTKGFFE